MKNFTLRFIKPLFDNQRGQRFLRKVHLMILYMQNYGLNGDFLVSGETNLIMRLKKHFASKKGLILFDVGANVGDYTVFMDQNMPQDRTIYCFEPSAGTFEELKENTKNIKNVHLINKGLGDKNEQLTLYSNNVTNKQSSVLKRDMSHWDENYNLTNEETIQLTTLDDFCKEEGIGHIDFLKVDVEGNEMNLFNGAQNMLQNGKVGFIQFELGVASVDGKYFFKDVFYLLSKNYRIYRITTKNIFEITHYNEQFEVFLTTNYLAVHRNIQFSS